MKYASFLPAALIRLLALGGVYAFIAATAYPAQPASKPAHSPNPSAIRLVNGAMEVFAIGNDGAIWHNWAGGPSRQFRPEWTRLGMDNLSRVVATRNADGRQQLFALGVDHNVYTIFMQTNNKWSAWENLGGDLASIAVGTNASDGRILAVGVSCANKSMMRCWQNAPNGRFGKWATLGGSFAPDSVAVQNGSDGLLHIFGIVSDGTTADNTVRTLAQTRGGGWASWMDLGGFVSSNSEIAVAKNADGRLELFAIGSDQTIWHCAQINKNGEWGGLEKLGGDALIGKITAAYNADGRLQVFALDSNGTVFSYWQTREGGWSRLLNMGGTNYHGLCCGFNIDKKIELFSCGGDRFMWRKVQRAPDGGFLPWARIGSTQFK